MRRREFLLNSTRAALAFPLLPLAGCTGRATAVDAKWAALVADLEKRLPALLADAATVPSVSMALVSDAKLIWRSVRRQRLCLESAGRLSGDL
jgi:hypothetical protein